MDKTHTRNRETTPFIVRVEHGDGEILDHTVAGVIDASGTWATRNPLGTAGMPAIGEDSRRGTGSLPRCRTSPAVTAKRSPGAGSW